MWSHEPRNKLRGIPEQAHEDNYHLFVVLAYIDNNGHRNLDGEKPVQATGQNSYTKVGSWLL